MYLHLGQEVVVKTSDVIGIFDLEKTSTSKKTKDFLVSATKRGEVITVSYEMPKTFIITKNRDKTTVYISQISSTTIKKRANVK
ncbi:MAG: extracellular matrix/biofilm biosynthesis regulator RemA family protein [Oscillospiraceae bacterium]